MTKPISMPGLVGDIARALQQVAFIAPPQFCVGASLSIVSSLTGARYRVAMPVWATSRFVSQVVNVSVVLVGHSGSGKGNTMDAVRTLFRLANDPALSEGFPPGAKIWLDARDHPGRLYLVDTAPLSDLLLYDVEIGNSHVRSNTGEVLLALQNSTHGRSAVLPRAQIETGLPDSIRASPVTILAETYPTAIKRKLPEVWCVSPFYGRMLMVESPGLSLPNWQWSANDNVARFPGLMNNWRTLAAQRVLPDQILVGWSADAHAFLRDFGSNLVDLELSGVDEPDLLIIRDHTAQIASLLAIGIDPKNPVITLQLVSVALDVADSSFDVMRRGLNLRRVDA